jgi:hypothetical protein
MWTLPWSGYWKLMLGIDLSLILATQWKIEFSPYEYLFYLKWFIKIDFFFNFIPFNIFYLSDLVLILLIDICFIWNYFLKFIFYDFILLRFFSSNLIIVILFAMFFFPWKFFLDWSLSLRFHAPGFNLLIIEFFHWTWI